MKRLITIIVVSMLLQSCGTGKTIPLKGKYQNPNVFYFDKTIDDVWNGLMKVIVQKGISVQSFEKSSGVIFGDEVIFFLKTYENEKGELVDKNAHIVTEKFINGEYTVVPSFAKARCNFLVYQQGLKTVLYINVYNEIGESIGDKRTFSPSIYRAESTGNFEKMIADAIVF